jgi:uncharacterized protein YbjT (DUF2867 family)
MAMEEIYLVAGATGALGQQIVSRLLRQNKHVRALVRDKVKGRALLGENLELAQGDLRQIDTLHEAVRSVSTVICVVGTRTVEGANNPQAVDYEGVRNLATAAKAAGVQHFILISSLGVTHEDHPLNTMGRVLEWKKKGEDALRASGLTYTIIRPGGLTDEPGGQRALKLDQGDKISGHISRADTADVSLQALNNPRARNATFEVIEVEGQQPDTLDSLFDSLKSDQEAAANAG